MWDFIVTIIPGRTRANLRFRDRCFACLQQGHDADEEHAASIVPTKMPRGLSEFEAGQCDPFRKRRGERSSHPQRAPNRSRTQEASVRAAGKKLSRVACNRGCFFFVAGFMVCIYWAVDRVKGDCGGPPDSFLRSPEWNFRRARPEKIIAHAEPRIPGVWRKDLP